MFKLPNTLRDWNSVTFNQTLKAELESLPVGSLPLAKGTSEGGYVDDSNLSVTVLQTHDDEQYIQAKLGIFFTEIMICCGCGDDPTPKNAYCEMQVQIDKSTADAHFTVLPL